jgi:TP901 family phage tail tape measure protein
MANDLNLRVLFGLVDSVTRPLRNILSANNATASSLQATRERLKELNKAQRDVEGFRNLKAGTTATGRELAQARAKVAALAQALNANGPPTREMVRDFEEAKQAAQRLTQQHRQQHAQLQQLRTRLAGAGIDTRNLSQHERELRQNLQSTTEEMQRQQRELAELTARQQRLAAARDRMNAAQATAGKMAATGAGMMAAGAATGAALSVPVTEYAKAEDSASQLKGALMKAGAVVPPEFEKINTLALKMGDSLPGTTADFQDMMTMLVRQGISAQAILGGMGEATAYLGVQLKKGPADAAEFAAKLQDATKTAEGDMLSLMDVVQKSFNLGVDDGNMLNGFVKLAPAMDTIKQRGIEGAKAMAPLLVMADQAGMAGEVAGNAYRKIFQLGMDAKKMGNVNKLLGKGMKIDFTDGKGEFGGLDNLFKQLDKIKGLSTQKRLAVLKEGFGDDAETLGVLSVLMEKGAAGYAEVQAKMAAQASLQERVNDQLGTLKNLWEAAGGTFSNAMVAFGESIAPELKATAEWLGEMAQATGAWARENPVLAGGLMKAAAGLAIVLTVGGALVLMLGAILGPLAMLQFSMVTLGMQGGILARVLTMGAGALRLVSSGVMFLGRALMMNPIGLAITAIAVAALLIYKYWEPIKAFFGGLWDQVRTAFNGGIGSISALIVNWSPVGLFYKAFAAVMSYFGVDLPSTFTAFGSNIIAGLVNGITNSLGSVKTAITGAADSTVAWFKEKLGIHSPSRVFGELGGFISEGAAGGIDSGQGKVMKAAAALATVATTSFGQPNLAAAAQLGAGQALAPITAQVPIDSRKSVLAPAAGGPAGGGGGGAAAAAAGPTTYTININPAPGADPAAIARAVAAELDKRERAQQARRGSRLTD